MIRHRALFLVCHWLEYDSQDKYIIAKYTVEVEIEKLLYRLATSCLRRRSRYPLAI